MKIVVGVKQVPEISDVKVNPETGTLVREGVTSILNPFCEYALDHAVRLKSENKEAEIIALAGQKANPVWSLHLQALLHRIAALWRRGRYLSLELPIRADGIAHLLGFAGRQYGPGQALVGYSGNRRIDREIVPKRA